MNPMNHPSLARTGRPRKFPLLNLATNGALRETLVTCRSESRTVDRATEAVNNVLAVYGKDGVSRETVRRWLREEGL